MNSQYSAQDVMRCDVCETPFKEPTKVHFDSRGSNINFFKCQKHPTNEIQLHCQNCNNQVCASCALSKNNNQHKKLIENDLKELKTSIYRKYEEAKSKLRVHRDKVNERSINLKRALREQKDALHKEIDATIKSMESEIDGTNTVILTDIEKEEGAIRNTIFEIKKRISDLQNLLDSDDDCLVSEYTSRNEEFRSFPAQFQVTLPTFTPQEINRDQIYQQVGSLSKPTIPTRPFTNNPTVITEELGGPMKTPGAVSYPPARHLNGDQAITNEKHGGPMETPGAVSPPQARPFIAEPRILKDIQTKYVGNNSLHAISRLSDTELWTCGYNDKIMTLYNIQGEELKSVQTNFRNKPWDIAVTDRDLFYADCDDRSINRVTIEPISPLFRPVERRSCTNINPLVRLRGWRPRNLCCTSSGDLLVIIDRDDNKQTKVVRYSGSKKKQSIQWDDQGKAIYSSHSYSKSKYISENRNLDICVADYHAHAVVVVSADGKLRFRYTGPISTTTTGPFTPRGITTNSQGHILTADCDNHRIHVVDQDGHFLRYIDNCGLQWPWGLCVDSRDNLFVAEVYTGRVKKIQYYL